MVIMDARPAQKACVASRNRLFQSTASLLSLFPTNSIFSPSLLQSLFLHFLSFPCIISSLCTFASCPVADFL